jgi:hypothetical protein
MTSGGPNFYGNFLDAIVNQKNQLFRSENPYDGVNLEGLGQ